MRLLNLVIQLIFIFLLSCSSKDIKKNNGLSATFVQYSEFVKDTFYIDIQLPTEYFTKPEKKYPAVILLDGNFYFPMFSSIVHQYEAAGLLKPVVLISVGYKSFKTMDSLRTRDYLYPKALPSDELGAIGGGQRFKEYITKELLPKIDAEFKTEKETRSLLGHSFGGYFVLYSLLDQLKNDTNDFKTFISASPALWYNDFYLARISEELKKKKDTGLNVFLSVGAMEDSAWSVKPVKDLSAEIEATAIGEINFHSRIYTHLDHMDVGLLSFTKGLQDFLNEEK
jgi:predicted alpha/beta superfamily hydrolase